MFIFYLVVWSFGRLVDWSFGRLVVWSFGGMGALVALVALVETSNLLPLTSHLLFLLPCHEIFQIVWHEISHVLELL